MQTNVSIQNQGLIAWDGTAGAMHDVTSHVSFGYTFEVMADLAADAVFTFTYADPTAADPCVPDAAQPVEAMVTCAGVAITAGTPAELIIPAGTLAGSICSGSLPCKSGKFHGVTGTGAADVRAVIIRHGPMA